MIRASFLKVAAFSLTMLASPAWAVSPFEMPWVNADAAGTVYKSTDHPNGVFVMEFFANFCGPCNENAKNVDELAEQYGSEGRVQVLDVAIDQNDSEIARWISRHHPNHPVIKDVGRKAWREVGGQYIPTVVMADCKGREIFRHTGVWDASVKSQIRSTIDAQLTQSCE